MNFIDLIFPKRCVGCSKVGSYLCSSCVNYFSLADQICPMCGKGAMFGMTHTRCKRPLGLEGVTSVFKYQGLAGKLIKKLKYRGVFDIYTDVFEVLVSMGDFTPISHSPWLVTSVPLHPKRQRERGFNQADLLARSMADYFGFDYAPHLLIRSRYTKPQASLTGKERKNNLKGAFQLSDQVQTLAQTKILLVDDVWTTGTTLKECTKVLKRAKANQVWGFVVAS